MASNIFVPVNRHFLIEPIDKTQEEAALDLGASQTQVFVKILMPYLMPAIASSAVIAFLYSFEKGFKTYLSVNQLTKKLVIVLKIAAGKK